jgi:hypothetical protein
MVGFVNPGVWRRKKTDREFKNQPPYYYKGYCFIVERFGNIIHLLNLKCLPTARIRAGTLYYTTNLELF